MKMAMKIINLLIAFTLVFFSFVVVSYAGTCGSSDDGFGTTHSDGATPWTADSASYADVNYCVNTVASVGDTIIVPAGNATWENALTITFGVTLQGAGIGQTVITNGTIKDKNGDDQVFAYIPASPELNEAFRLTGFTFDGNGTNSIIAIANKTRSVISKIRIDHNKFQNSGYIALYFSGEIYALVDANTFEDNRKDFGVYGYNWYSWIDLSPPVLGSTHSIVFENNTFNYTDAWITAHPTWGTLGSAGHGGSYTFRYNTINNYPQYDILDAHGNQNPVTPEYSPGGSRGTIAVEIYENDISSNRVYGSRFLYHRGGTAIVFNNRITGTLPSASIVMIEEDGPARFNFLSKWPGYDPIQNTYYYNNTLNGNTIIPSVKSSAAFIQEGRDYWLTNPVGQTIGGSVYTPLQYPHPMLLPPHPPTALRETK